MCPGHAWCGHRAPAPLSQRALLQASVGRCWAGGRASPGELPCAVVRGVCGQALVLPRLPVLRAGCRGPVPTCCGRGCAGVWARHCPFGLHALQGAECRGGGGWPSRGGGGFHYCEGRLLSGAIPLPAPVPGSGQPGPVARVSRARVVWAWGPSTDPTACAYASRHCALWGWRDGVLGGVALRRCEGRLRSGARPSPAARPQGGLWRSAAHLLWARVC